MTFYLYTENDVTRKVEFCLRWLLVPVEDRTYTSLSVVKYFATVVNTDGKPNDYLEIKN